jgi:secreted Zn-dependent insulinase-like peptidase
MGSEKYKSESEFQDYMKSHSGDSFANTGLHYTNFYFYVSKGYLEEALDRY